MAGTAENKTSSADIIQRLHASEVNGSISWFFDVVWVCRIGDDLNGWKLDSKADDFESAIRDLAEKTFEQFPRSKFGESWAQARDAVEAERAASANIEEARAALRMIRQVVERHAPPDSMRSPEHMAPDIGLEAEEIVKGILAIVRGKQP